MFDVAIGFAVPVVCLTGLLAWIVHHSPKVRNPVHKKPIKNIKSITPDAPVMFNVRFWLCK